MAAPKLRFKNGNGQNYPEWEKKTVGSLANYIVGGGTPSTKNPAFYTGEIPWISSSDLVEDKINYLNMTRFITQDAINHSATKLIPAQSVMIVCRVGVGKVAVNELPLCTSQDFMNLIVKEESSPVFIGYLLMNLMVKKRNSVQGTAIKGIPSAEIKKFKVLVPAFPEQQKIANFLTTVDRQIDIQSQRVEAMKTRKKGLLQKIFSQEIHFKDDEGKDYPKWDEKKIGEFSQCIAGATPSTKEPRYWKNGNIPWMSSGEVNNRIIYSTEKKISSLGYENSSTKMLPENTVIMALAGQGKTRGMVAITRIRLCTNQSLCGIVTDSSMLSDYLYQFLLTQYEYLRLISSGDGTRGGLNKKIVSDCNIPVPTLPEQQKIADFLTAVDKQIEVEEKRLETMKNIKKGLLQQMFI